MLCTSKIINIEGTNKLYKSIIHKVINTKMSKNIEYKKELYFENNLFITSLLSSNKPNNFIIEGKKTPEYVTLEHCSIIYFPGYLIYKQIKIFDYEVYKSNLISKADLGNKNQLRLICIQKLFRF